MKNNVMYKFVALAASVALAGCVAPGSLTRVDTATKGAVASTQATQSQGTVQLSVHWPKRGGMSTQDIPNRAEKVVVTLTDKNGAELHRAEAGRSYYGRIDTYSSNFSWNLPQQEGVTVKAELFDAGSAKIGEALKEIDVVAGHNAYVGLDIVIENAPHIAGVDKTRFRIDDQLVISGSGFGKTEGYEAQIYLESEGVFTNYGSPFPYHYNYMVYLPSSVATVSNDQIEVKIPDQVDGYGRLTDRLWNYFHGDDTQKLYLGVVVDGVNSNRIEVSMAKTATASATVRLEQGQDAPAHTPVAHTKLDLATSSYAVPIASGTQWTFRNTQDWGYEYGYQNTQNVTVRLMDNHGMAEIAYPYWSDTRDLLPDYDSGPWYEQPMDFLLRLNAMGQIQVLGQEEILMPDGYQRLATHLFYNLPIPPNSGYNGGLESGRSRDVWIVPNVGVVRMVETRLVKYQYEENVRREVQTYELVGFQPGSASAQ